MNKTFKEVFDDHIKTETRKGRKKQGIIGRKNRLRKFLVFLETKGKELNAIDMKTALEYQRSLLQSRTKEKKHYTNSTVCCYIGTAKAFCKYLVEKELLHTNPFDKLKKPRREKRLPENILNESEMAALLQRLSDFTSGENLKRKITRYRVHVIAELMYATGIRIDEAAHLRVRDIDFKRGMIEVKEGTGGASRVAYMTQYASKVLKLYVDKMRELIMTEWWNKDLLFGIEYGNLGKLMNKTLAKAAAEAGVSKITTHSFRHALGFHLLRAGCHIRHIQAILGHKQMRNTEVYLKAAVEDLKEMLDKCHPRQWRKQQNE
jgi:integrase/recombinase XerD